jgi:Pectate lyase superfamily protein
MCRLLFLSLGVLLLPPRLIANDRPVGAMFDEKISVRFPDTSAVIDVTKAPYFAKGDGKTDNTESLQKALSDVMGAHKILYFPNGTYLISRTLFWSKKNSKGEEAWGMNWLQGENGLKTIIRLKDGVFGDPVMPSSMMWCGGFGSADWFHNYVQDLTFDVGANNPGAIGLQFYSNNSGAVRNCRFLAGAGSGMVGIDLGHRDMNGPLLVSNCEVVGFQRGICTSHAVNGQTLEHITLRAQTQFGIINEGQAISIRSLLSENAVPAIQSYGTCCMLDANLKGTGAASSVPAIVNFNGGRVFLRNVSTIAYGRALGDVTSPDSTAAFRLVGEDKPGSRGPNIDEYCSHEATILADSKPGSIRLMIKEPPATYLDKAEKWANVDDFGADPTGQSDSSIAIQKAIDSGAFTVFFPGSYALTKSVAIRGQVRRLIGAGGSIDYFKKVHPDFRIGDSDSEPLTIEHFSAIHGGIEIDSPRTIVFRSVSDCDLTMLDRSGGGEVFLEDFVTHALKVKNQKIWARQLNVENEGKHIVNDQSDLWVLGYKTERGGTLLETRGKGNSEILGGFSYTTTSGNLGPMFVNTDSSVFAFFSEVCYNGDPFATLIEESRSNQKKFVPREKGTTAPYYGKR